MPMSIRGACLKAGALVCAALVATGSEPVAAGAALQAPAACVRNDPAAVTRLREAVAASPDVLAPQLDLARCYDASWRWNALVPAIARAMEILDALAESASAVPSTPPDTRLIGGIHVPMPQRTKEASPDYPHKAYAAGLAGLVIVELVIDPKGNVREARAVRSIPEFDDAALRAAKRWKFAITKMGDAAVEVVTFGALRFGAPAETVPSDYLDLAQLHQEHGRYGLAKAAMRAALAHAQRDHDRFAGAGVGPIVAGPGVTPPKKTRHVNPQYPAAAIQMRDQGTVIIEAMIDTRGTVGRTRIVSKPSMLDAAASAAVGQWEFAPAMKDGVPIPVRMTVTVSFTMR